MPLLSERDRAAVHEELEKLTNPVRIVFFTQALDCDTCEITQKILAEVAALSSKLELQTHNFAIDREAVAQYEIMRVPAFALVRVETRADGEGPQASRERDYGIRFYGVPSGYEFMSLIGGLLDVSHGDSGLSDQSKALLARVTEPVHFQIFTTPT